MILAALVLIVAVIGVSSLAQSLSLQIGRAQATVLAFIFSSDAQRAELPYAGDLLISAHILRPFISSELFNILVQMNMKASMITGPTAERMTASVAFGRYATEVSGSFIPELRRLTLTPATFHLLRYWFSRDFAARASSR